MNRRSEVMSRELCTIAMAVAVSACDAPEKQCPDPVPVSSANEAPAATASATAEAKADALWFTAADCPAFAAIPVQLHKSDAWSDGVEMGRREFLTRECAATMRRLPENEVQEWARREIVLAVASQPFVKDEAHILRRQGHPSVLVLLRLLQETSALRAAIADQARRNDTKQEGPQ